MNIFHRLGSADRHTVAVSAFALLDAMQQQPPEAQVMAGAITFLAMCARFGVDPREALNYTHNLLNADAGASPEFRCVRSYMDREIDDKGRAIGGM